MSGFMRVLLAVVVMLAACEVERGDSSFEEQGFADVGDSGAGVRGDVGLGQGPGAGTMSGTWLLYHERSTCVLGQEQLTHATYLVEIEQDGAAVVEQRRLCNTELSPVLGTRVTIAPEVLESIEFVEVDRGVVSTLVEGGTYVSSTEVALWGVELDDPMTDALPQEASDTRVIDGEGDGNPGVTFLVGGDCERYQGQRQVIKYRGSFTAPNRIDGESTGVTDLSVFGGSGDFCQVAPPVESNDADSRFRMVRVDGLGGSYDADVDADGTISCDEAMAIAGSVLEEREVDNANCRRR